MKSANRPTLQISTALLTFLITKHINSCNNVFLKEYFLLATYGVFRPLNHCNHYIKKFYKSVKKWGGVRCKIIKTLIFRGYCIDKVQDHPLEWERAEVFTCNKFSFKCRFAYFIKYKVALMKISTKSHKGLNKEQKK